MSLIEVLVSLFILSLILLGMNALEIYALRENRAAYFFTVATHQLHAMQERLQISEQQDISEQITIWNQQNKTVLPDGRGEISGNFPSYTITIFWSGLIPWQTMQLTDSL